MEQVLLGFSWGIFRRHRGNLGGALERTILEDMDIDDDDSMEVDMVGGGIVGTVDVIPKQPSVPTFSA